MSRKPTTKDRAFTDRKSKLKGPAVDGRESEEAKYWKSQFQAAGVPLTPDEYRHVKAAVIRRAI